MSRFSNTNNNSNNRNSGSANKTSRKGNPGQTQIPTTGTSNRIQSQPQHRLIGFGSNYFHALGGTSPIVLPAGEVPAWEYVNIGFDIQQLCCTTSSSIILSKSGKIYQAGMLHGLLREKPERLYFNQRVLEVAGGRHFCLARSEHGLVMSWGAGHFGQLGHGPHVSILEKPQVITPLMPSAVGGSPIIAIACGAWHGAALLQDGRLFTWGSNRRNQCGFTSPSTIVYPQVVEGRYSEIACGKGHNVAIEQETGCVYTWGSSAGCGHSSRKTTVQTPRLLEALQRVVIVAVAAGDSHSLALSGGGRVFSWGLGPEGQLGMGGALASISRPKLVADLDFVAIVAGQQKSASHTTMVDTQASVGDPRRVETGLSPDLCELVDDAVVELENSLDASRRNESTGEVPKNTTDEKGTSSHHLLANVPKVVRIHAAGSYSMAISSSGHLYAWGYNDPGNLGLPHLNDLPQVEAATTVATIAQVKSRASDVQAFDSRHNVLLPKRVDALSDIDTQLVAGGPSHLLVYGKVRDPRESLTIGRTLYEVQQARRSNTILPMSIEQDELSVHSTETDVVTMATDTLSCTTDALSSPSAMSPQSNDTNTSAQTETVVTDNPRSQKKPRSSHMSKLIQKLTNGSERKRNGDAPRRHSIGRVLSAAFGSK